MAKVSLRKAWCATCKYYQGKDNEATFVETYSLGICRRYPPQIIVQEGFTAYEQFPEVHSDWWCGEHHFG